MPSWNIHTAHVERLFTECEPADLGIADANAFLFGNYIPDVYLGFMVENTTFRLDYCITHMADVNTIPIPDADRFWDHNVYRRRPPFESGVSLTVGAWAHLLADNVYNTRFRAYVAQKGLTIDDDLRKRKQADFDLFGRSLDISSRVRQTPELEEAAYRFRPYSILPADIARSIEVADAIVAGDDAMRGDAAEFSCGHYQELGSEWMQATFDACHDRLRAWLLAWQRLERQGARPKAAEIRAEIGDGGLA